ncbi:MAG: hypothetical protein ACI4RP_00370 [Acutalibacteraceae bacterium]
MRKTMYIALAIIMCLIFTSCERTKYITAADLTENDLSYIDSVYNAMDYWDTEQQDGSETFRINKIAFYDFDGTNKIVFYKNYPITDYYGSGYYVSSDGLEPINPGIYDHDEKIIHTGCLARTSYNGVGWKSDASDEEKYKLLQEAYIKYLNEIIQQNK